VCGLFSHCGGNYLGRKMRLIVCSGCVQIGHDRLYCSTRLIYKLPNKRHQNKRLGRMHTHKVKAAPLDGSSSRRARAFFSKLNNVLWSYTLRPAARCQLTEGQHKMMMSSDIILNADQKGFTPLSADEAEEGHKN
jgi:hypothetical protein